MRKFRVSINDKIYEVEVEELESESNNSKADSSPVIRPSRQQQTNKSRYSTEKQRNLSDKNKNEDSRKKTKTDTGENNVLAPLPGTVISIEVDVGDSVQEGDLLFVLDAMKMENNITAPVSGVISSIEISEKQNVKVDQIMAVINDD